MKTPGLHRVGSIVVICAAAGALAGIAGSAAAPSTKSSKSSKSRQAQALRHARRFERMRGPGFGPGPFIGGPGGPAVHSEIVVPNASGNGFDTITSDAGKLKSVDGTKLTLTEGTDKATYGTPTIDVGSDAKVFRNHQKATLGDLKEGDDVRIIKSPRGTLVWAEDATFEAQEQKNRPHFGHGGWGPPPGGGGYPGDKQNGSDSPSPPGGSNS